MREAEGLAIWLRVVPRSQERWNWEGRCFGDGVGSREAEGLATAARCAWAAGAVELRETLVWGLALEVAKR